MKFIQALGDRRALRTGERRIATLRGDRGSVRSYLAGVKTRGDVLGGRSLEVGRGGITLNGERAGVLQRERHLQQSVLEAKLVRTLREQYECLTTDELMQRIRSPFTQLEAEAIAGVAAMRCALDQPEFLGALVQRYRNPRTGMIDAEAADSAIARVRDLRFGALLEASPTLANLSLTKGDWIDGGGNVTFGIALATMTSRYSGDRLANQTDLGWKVLRQAKMERGDLESLAALHEVASDVQARIAAHLAATAGDPEETVYGEAEGIGKMLISDKARNSINHNPNLKAKIGWSAQGLIS